MGLYKYLFRPLYSLHIILTLLRNTQALQLTAGWKYVTPNHNGPISSQPIDPGHRSGSSVWTSKAGLTVVFGGRGLDYRDNNGSAITLVSDLWGFNASTNTWTELTSYQSSNYSELEADSRQQVPAGREMAAMCGTRNGDGMVIFGGRVFNNVTNDTCTATDEILVFNLSDTTTWKIVTNKNSPSARFDSLFWCDEDNDVMRLEGGRGVDGRLIEDSWNLHLTNLTWVKLSSKSNGGESGLHGIDRSALLWKLSNGSLYLMRDKIELTNGKSSDFIVQLWKRQGSSPTSTNGTDDWLLINESNQGKITWPGVHRHGGTCTDANGNLWLFNGESEIDDQLYLNNDLWFYNVTSNVWSKVEQTTSSGQPEQRHMSATWCFQNTLYSYGGSKCSDVGCPRSHSNAECLLGDLWKLNITTNRKNSELNGPKYQTQNHEPVASILSFGQTNNKSSKPAVKPSETVLVQSPPPTGPKTTKQKPKIVSNAIPHLETTTTTTAITSKTPTKDATPPVNGTIVGTSITTSPFHDLGDGGASSSAILNHMLNRPSGDMAENIDLHSMTAVQSDESTNHGVYGSAIFFGISITMFSLFGLVVFFRRCVSCPPRENLLLKEPPPVRYTVIPDDSYSI